MDLVTFRDGLAAIKSAVDIVKGILQRTSIPSEVREQLSTLQTSLISANVSALEAQAAHATLLARVNTLEQEIVRMKDWDAEKIRYQLAPIWGGAVLAYALKESEAGGQPAHALCANCFHTGRKSFLQTHNPPRQSNQNARITCSACRADISTRFHQIGPPHYAEHYLSPPATTPDSGVSA